MSAVTEDQHRFGLRGHLPEGDPLRAPHLLGGDWLWEKWYATQEERDEAYERYAAQHPYYRKGDFPSMILEKVER